MNLLDALKNKKQFLKSTQTTITYADGRKFVDNHGNISEIQHSTYGFVVDNKPDNIPARINDFVYIGSQDCTDISVLTKFNITFVLSIGIDSPQQYPGVIYKFVHCLDLPETDIVSILKLQCISFINTAEEKKCNVLVHCNAGVSRSSAIVIGYIMLMNNLDYNVAYNLVKEARSSIKPNPGFEKQLKCLK